MLMGTSSKISFYMSHIWMNVIWHTMWKAWIIEWGCEDHSHRITPSTLFTSLPMLIPSVFYSLFLKFPPVQLSVLLILCTQLPYKIYIHSFFYFPLWLASLFFYTTYALFLSVLTLYGTFLSSVFFYSRNPSPYFSKLLFPLWFPLLPLHFHHPTTSSEILSSIALNLSKIFSNIFIFVYTLPPRPTSQHLNHSLPIFLPFSLFSESL